jgi:WD40 repeat protein
LSTSIRERLRAEVFKWGVHLWERASGEKRAEFHLPHEQTEAVTKVAFSSDGRLLIVGTNLGDIHVFDLATGTSLRKFDKLDGAVNNLFFSPDGTSLIVVVHDQNASKPRGSERPFRLLSLATGKELFRFGGHSALEQRVALSPDGTVLAAPNWREQDGVVYLWNVKTGREIAKVEGHDSAVESVAFSPDEKRVATPGSMDGTLRVWDAVTGRPLMHIRRSPRSVNACAFSADGRTLFSCWDDKLMACDAATSRELHTWKLEDPDQPKARQRGFSMHLSDDGRKMLVFSYGSERMQDWVLTGWDTTTRKQLFRPRLAFRGDLWIAVSSDAHLLALPAASAVKERVGSSRVGEQCVWKTWRRANV